MPTGYTHGILDGKVNTFPEFAKLCMKAFGACIHMRDDNSDKPYVPQKVSNYHTKALKEAKLQLIKAKTIPDHILIKREQSRLETREAEIILSIKRITKNSEKLKTMIVEASMWVPPTSEHKGLKTFMIEQLTSTLEHDGDDSYYKRELACVRKSLKKIDPQIIKSQMVTEAQSNITYHTKQLKEEEQRVADANKWVDDLYKSLEK